jgi:DNA polymerase I-like protein with 3'-5' exonuclease and polymerase domains
MKITLYDELGASISEEKEALRIKEIMENIIPFKVPHNVDYKLGPNWSGK